MSSKLDVAKLSFAEITKLAPAERIELMAGGVALTDRIHTQQETERKIRPAYAKVVAALKRDHTALLDAKSLPRDTSFRKYFTDNCGGDLPGRLDALSTLFNALCLCEYNGKPLLAEETYDSHSTNSLELANACINHVKSTKPEIWMGHDDTLDVLSALSKPGDATAKLKVIRNRQKGITKEDAKPVEVTTAMAVAHILAAIGAAKDMTREAAADLFASTLKIGDAWETSGIESDELDKWAVNIGKGVAPTMEIVTDKSAKKSAAKTPALAA
jgi:hypothetical protein